MKKLLVLCACSLTVFAADRDTVPLKQSKVKVEGSSAPSGGVPIVTEGEFDAPGENPQPFIASVEVYGSSRLNEVVLKETLGKELDQWLTMGLQGDPKSPEWELKLAEKVRKKFDLHSAEWSIVEYFEPGKPAIHVTLDVMEKEDVSRRMPFLPSPKGDFSDPDNLIKRWMEYEDLALSLIESGQLEPEADECKAYHCPFGHEHAQLKKFEKIFLEGVKKHEKALVEIQSKDKRPEWRAAATYLLPYLKDGKKVVSYMVDRIKDPDAGVRNNALRVLGDLAEFHPEFVIPVKPILEALEFPRSTDRSKAIYVAYLMSLSSQEVRNQIQRHHLDTLIQMLGSKQPDHFELAHGILRKISGKEYAANDVQSWRNWAVKLAKDSRTVSRK